MFNEAFGIYLRNKQVLTETILTEHLNTASENHVPLIKELIDSKVLSEATAYTHFASFMNIPIRDFQLTEINFDLIRNYPREKLILNSAIPYRDNDTSVIFAISDPFRLDGIADIEKYIGKRIEYFLIQPSRMAEILGYVSNKIQQNSVLDDFSNVDVDISEVEGDELTEEDAPVIVLCDSILKDAVARGASDIHIEPYEKTVRVRYRIDGKLTLINNLRAHLYQSILARFKIMAELNIAERRIPQDGKISMQLNGSNYDFRVSTLPSIHGEKIVIRIYNKSLVTKDVSILGFNSKQEEIIYDAISRPHGIILLTGPTGSGKSTTLYTFLRHLNKEDTNIITVEDPVENEINGITQVQVNPKADLTFASALRSILRQDPNVIMIGEIRDEETAQIAVRAALTGHLVFSTIHTNDAASVVSRLIDMGIAPYLVSDSLLCSISQRLVRKLCPFCKQEHITTPAEQKHLRLKNPATIFEPKGCPACNHTGYQGRLAVFEIVPINSEIRSIVMSKNYTSELLNKYVSKTFPTLMDDAREHVLAGDTSMSEFEDLMDVIQNTGSFDEQDADNFVSVEELLNQEVKDEEQDLTIANNETSKKEEKPKESNGIEEISEEQLEISDELKEKEIPVHVEHKIEVVSVADNPTEAPSYEDEDIDESYQDNTNNDVKQDADQQEKDISDKVAKSEDNNKDELADNTNQDIKEVNLVKKIAAKEKKHIEENLNNIVEKQNVHSNDNKNISESYQDNTNNDVKQDADQQEKDISDKIAKSEDNNKDELAENTNQDIKEVNLVKEIAAKEKKHIEENLNNIVEKQNVHEKFKQVEIEHEQRRKRIEEKQEFLRRVSVKGK